MNLSMGESHRTDQRLAHAGGPEYILPVECFRDIYDVALVQHGNRPALVSVKQHDDSYFAGGPKVDFAQDCIRYTFRELHQHASLLATSMYAQGLCPQQTFATILPNSAEFAIALLAAAILNVTFVPLDSRGLTRPDEVRHQLKTVRPDALLVSDEQCAESVDQLGAEVHKPSLRILISGTSASTPGWLRLKGLFKGTTEQSAYTTIEQGLKAVDIEKDIALMIFTSGTSGLPKACRLTSRNVASFIRIPEAIRAIKPEDRFLQHFPISHVAAIAQILQHWAAGACVVIPSSSFDSRASLHAIERERCTRMTAVPSIIDQIIDLPEFSPKKVQSLNVVLVGATIVSPEVIAKCKESAGLGVRGVFPVYGMTEALSVLIWDEHEDLIIEHGFASVGKPLRGTKIKICPPESQETCIFGEVGELHVSTPALIPGYLGVEDRAFYHEGGCRWLATGDQARMHASGAVFILGRYKDVIIRGGENLSPAIIEHCINSQFPSAQVQVVGVDDPIAGESPVAVVRCPDGFRPDAAQIQKVVRERLGPASVPERFLGLHDLSLESFPSTTSGKVKKHDLKKLVIRHFETKKRVYNQEKLPPHSGSLSLSMKSAMLETLQDLLGHDSQDRSLEHEPLPRILDSLSMMKFASTLRIKYNMKISTTDMSLSKDLDDLVSRAKLDNNEGLHLSAELSKAPEHRDMIHEEERGQTRSCAEPALQKLGLNWDADVQEVYPIVGTSVWSWMKEVPFGHKWSLATPFSSYDEVRHAVEISLCQWPVLRSVVVGYNENVRLMVALRAHKPYFDLAITSLPQVKSREALGNIDTPAAHARGSFPEGLLFHVGIAKIEKTGRFDLLIAANHAVYDNISIHSWAEDLQRIMTGDTMVVRTPFKLFVDAYYAYQDSLLAKQARVYHRQQFEQTGIERKALWPAGDCSIASILAALSTSTNTSSKKPVVPNNDPSLGDRQHGACILEQTLHCPNLTKTRFAQDLSPAIIAKMAISLFNSCMTGQPYAIFTMLMAGRVWPFMSSGISGHLPSPYDIAGPTLASVVDVIRVDPQAQEEVGQLYTRIEAEQRQSSRHQHIPWSMLLQLNDDSHGMRMEAMRQVFNWIPGRHGKEANASSGLHAVGIPGHDNIPPAGVVWICKLIDSETLSVRLRWNSILFSEEEGAQFVEMVLHIVKWICEPENWQEKIEKLYPKVTAGNI